MKNWGLENFDNGRFIPSDAPVTDIVGIPASAKLIEELARFGMHTVETSDDLQTASPAIDITARQDSPIGRILINATPDDDPNAFVEILHRIVTDVNTGQFEANWPEYLDNPLENV